MAVCVPEPTRGQSWAGPAWVTGMLRRMQDRYEVRRSAANLGRLTDEDLRDMGLTRDEADWIRRHPYRH